MLYPNYFETHVGNSSSLWEFSQLKASRKRKEPYPQMPVLTAHSETLAEIALNATPVLIEPGDLVSAMLLSLVVEGLGSR